MRRLNLVTNPVPLIVIDPIICVVVVLTVAVVIWGVVVVVLTIIVVVLAIVVIEGRVFPASYLGIAATRNKKDAYKK